MKHSLIARIEELESKVSHTTNFETFKSEWDGMDEISKAMFIFYAEQPQIWDDTERRYLANVREYLDAMGLIDRNAESIIEVAKCDQ